MLPSATALGPRDPPSPKGLGTEPGRTAAGWEPSGIRDETTCPAQPSSHKERAQGHPGSHPSGTHRALRVNVFTWEGGHTPVTPSTTKDVLKRHDGRVTAQPVETTEHGPVRGTREPGRWREPPQEECPRPTPPERRARPQQAGPWADGGRGGGYYWLRSPELLFGMMKNSRNRQWQRLRNINALNPLDYGVRNV